MCCAVHPITSVPDSRQHRDNRCQKWGGGEGAVRKAVEEGSVLREKAKATSRRVSQKQKMKLVTCLDSRTSPNSLVRGDSEQPLLSGIRTNLPRGCCTSWHQRGCPGHGAADSSPFSQQRWAAGRGVLCPRCSRQTGSLCLGSPLRNQRLSVP